MLIYQKYIIRSIFGPLFFSVLAVTGIVWLSQILRLGYLFETKILLVEFLLITLLIIPSLVHSILPLALLYSSLYCYNILKINKEIIALKASGINIRQLIYPLLYVSTLVSLFAIINASIIMPLSYHTLKEKIFQHKNSFVCSVIAPGIFTPLSKNLVLFLNDKKAPREFGDIIIFDHRSDGPPSILFAKKGEIRGQEFSTQFYLIEGMRHSFSKSGSFEIMNFDRFNITLNQSESQKRGYIDQDVMEMYIWDLLHPRNLSREKSIKFIAEGHGRISWCAMSILVPLLAICISLRVEFRRKETIIHILKACSIPIIFVSAHFVILSISYKYIIANYFLYINLCCGISYIYFLSAGKNLNTKSIL